jgi:hypothetical protein
VNSKNPKILVYGVIVCFVIVMTHPVFAFYGQDLDTINKLFQRQESLGQKVDSKIVEDQTIEKLITSLEIKNSAVNEKEQAYDKAINELKWWVSGFGVLCVVILIFFGLIEDKKIKQKKDELSAELVSKKQELENLYKDDVVRLDKEHKLHERENYLKRQEELLSFKG